MKTLLNTVRWLFSLLFGLVFFTIITVTPLLISTSLIITNRESVKGWAQQSGIYEQMDEIVTSAFKQQLQKSESSEQPGGSPITEKELEELISDILTPQFSQKVLESTLDGIYDYLEGNTNTMTIEVDREEIENAFFKILFASSGLKIDSAQQVRDLPACTPKQEKQLESRGSFKSIEDACLPEGFDLDKIFEQTVSQSGTEITDTGKINLTPGGVDTTQIETAFPIQFGFQASRMLPLILALIILVFSLLLVTLVPGWKHGLLFTGIVGLLGSLLSLTIALILYFGDTIPGLVLTLTNEFEAKEAALIQNFSQIILRDFFGKAVIVSLILIIFFVAIALSSLLLKKPAEMKA